MSAEEIKKRTRLNSENFPPLATEDKAPEVEKEVVIEESEKQEKGKGVFRA